MIESLKKALKIYTRKPKPFFMVSLFHLLAQVLVALAFFGVVFAGIFIVSMAGLSIEHPAMLILALLATGIYWYLATGFFGAYVKGLDLITHDHKTDFFGFYNSGMKHARTYFGIFIVKVVLELIFTAPIAIAYFVFLKNVKNIPYLEHIVVALVFLAMFLANFVTFFGYFSAATLETGSVASIKSSFRVVGRRHIFSLIYYGVLAAVFTTAIIPLLNLLTLFVTLPIVVTGLAIFTEDTLKRQ